MIENVFVYGTLRVPRKGVPADDCRYHPHIAQYVQAVVPAQLSQADLFDLGSYPAAVPGQNMLYGDLLTVQSQALTIMDRIEGHPAFFKRAKVTIDTAAGTRKAWMYWAPRSLTAGKRCITGGDWFQRGQDNSPQVIDRPADVSVDAVLQRLVQRFAESKCSWLSTVRPDGRAHSAPVWHIWHRGRAYVVTRAKAVKTNNIQHNPGVVINHQDPDAPVIIEGWATFTPLLRAELRPIFLEKYQWDLETDADYDIIIEITPTKLMAWGKYGEGQWSGADVLNVWD